MSPIFSNSPKHCAEKGTVNIGKFCKTLLCSLSTLFSTILLFILLVYLILHPTKPEFSLQEADIYQLNLSTASLLNSSIQLTLMSVNPNKKVGIYYQDLQVYASYKSQQITTDVSLPPFYQGHEEKNLLTASLIGTGLPVAPSFSYEVGRDRIAGRLVLNLKVNGRIRWKVGTWISGRYPLNVNCVAYIALGQGIPSGPLSLRQGTQCSTTI